MVDSLQFSIYCLCFVTVIAVESCSAFSKDKSFHLYLCASPLLSAIVINSTITVISSHYFSDVSLLQALLEAVGSSGVTGAEALAAAEKHAALLTARAGARDPSAVPSICRISAALQYNSGMFSATGALYVFSSEMHVLVFYVINQQ